MDRHRISRSGRTNVALVIILTAAIFLTGGLFRLQVFEYSSLVAQSEYNRIRVVPVIPRRGIVYDRKGRVLIDNRPSYTVSIVPIEEVPGVTVENLSEIIGLDTLTIRKRMRRNMVSRYQPTAIKKDIPFDVVAILEEQYRRFPGISYQMERVREYAGGMGGESFTGYVGEVSEAELEKHKGADLRLGSMIGKKGLEKQYDRLLRGSEGTAYYEIHSSGQILGEYEGRKWVNADPGSDLTLTIDMDLQKACVEALDTFCCGAVVAMDPRNGEVLALMSYPSYDANIFSSVIPDSLWQEIRNNPDNPLINRPLTGQYPPASTFKLLTLGTGLEEGIITGKSTFQPCYGGMQFGNRYFRCWDPGGHGKTEAVGAVEQSCDVYFYQLGLKIGVDLLSDYMAMCGFGRVTGIDLPVEAAGLNPNSEYYDERYGKGKWTRTLVLNNAIGQGEILSTPLQLAQFYCGLVNDGVVYRPHIVKSVSEFNGERKTVSPEVAFRLPFSRETLDVLMQSLRQVVEGEDGTGRSLKNDKYTVGGKTGTAQNPHGENHALFVGVAPLEEPEIVVCAIVENAGHGSDHAVPMVREVLDTYFRTRKTPEKVAIVDGN